MTDPQLRSFLLRRLPAEETARMEESILLEDGFAERLCVEEFDLLDDYAASRLNAEDAADVQRYLLTSKQSQQSLRVARALQGVASQSRAPHDLPAAAAATSAVARRRTSRVWGFAALLAACLAVVAYAPQWRFESGQSSSAQLQVPIVSLMADVNRGPRPALAIPAGDGTVRLQAEVPEPSPGARYSLSIQGSDGRQLFAARALEVRTAGRYSFVETVVPSATLGPGNRTVVLTGAGAAANADTQFTWQVTGIIQ